MNEEIVRLDNYIFDERFYRKSMDGTDDEYRPSLTYVIGCAYPMDFGLVQWRGDVGNKRADEIMEETAEDGSYVHQALENIFKGEEIKRADIEARFSPKRSLKIMRCLQAALDWYNDVQPKILATEYIVWHDRFAGTVDLKCEIDGKTYILDQKTSKTIHSTHKVQIAGYGMADEADNIAILHLGNTTKKKYSFLVLDQEDRTKYEEQCNQTLTMFHTLNPNARPNSETYPDIFNLPL